MKVTSGFAGLKKALIEIFAAAFTASEGSNEGALAGDLARGLFTETPALDMAETLRKISHYRRRLNSCRTTTTRTKAVLTWQLHS